jgi:TPR repeat protein
MVNGMWDVAIDHWKAKDWQELAAENGDILALRLLHELWAVGFPKAGVPPNPDKSMDYLVQAARKGNGIAQYKYGKTQPTDSKSIVTWMTLSAAIGCALAQRNLGSQYYMYSPSKDENDPKSVGIQNVHLSQSLYWLKKAALQGEKEAQQRYVSVLLNARALELGEQLMRLGTVPFPRPCLFWCEFLSDEMKASVCNLVAEKTQRDGEGRANPMKILDQCACCGRPRGNVCNIQRCGKCRGIGYCGRACQTKHWKMGHKRDCKVPL